ncbi:DUF221-domain-containing protein, partial [Ramicandelaber brevisporus]
MASLETSRNFSSDLISVSTQAAIACGLSVAIIFSFELLRRKDRLWHLYSARTRLRYLPTPALPRRPFGWVRPIIQLDERFFLTHVGLDAVMHLRFLRMCMQIVLVACVICNVVLLPVNYLKGNNDPVDNGNHTRVARKKVSIHLFSLDHLGNKSNYFWFHLILLYALMLFIMYKLLRNTVDYVKMYADTLISESVYGQLSTRTILAEDIPKRLRSETALLKFFENLQVGNVEGTTVVRKYTELQKMLDKRKNIIDSLEINHITSPLNPSANGETPHMDSMTSTLTDGNSTNRVSEQSACTIDNQLSKLDRVEKRLENLRDLSRIDKLYRPTNAAFITFETQTAAHLAAQAFVFSSPHQMKLSLAPEPRDVIWDNFLFDEREKFIRKLVVRLFSYGLIIVWLIPMTLILGLVSLEQLNRIKFFANIISNSTIVRNFLQNNLPSILFSMFMALLPMVLMYISNRQAFRSYSELEEAALEKHLLFLWLNVVVLKLSTPRRTLRHQRPIAFTFFYYMPAHCMVFIITILYAVITPLILPFSLLYFAIGLLVYKHQFAVVYVKQFENHGRFWRHVINSVCLGMCVTTAVFTIIIFLKQSYVVAAATLPLFVLTIMYWQYMHEYWWKRMTFLPL